MLYFSKMQGTGNDFILINCIKNEFQYDLKILSKFLCDRHYGVGADGVIYLYYSKIADFKMRIFNQDGSEAEMCGNGIRCFAKYAYKNNLINKRNFNIETLAGIKKVSLEFEGENVSYISVCMGKAEISNINYIIGFENKEFQVYPILIGNPHAICFVKDVNKVDIQKIGPFIENYKYFPNKTNVEFVQIIDNENIKVRVWERGVGETNSCGTGATASAIISIYKKKMNNNLKVNLNGGILDINYYDENNLYLKGPAEFVFDGQIENI